MTDRELLEGAAKAAGLLPAKHSLDDLLKHWNPLRDGGDALALVVKLGICVACFPKLKNSMAGHLTVTGHAATVQHDGNAFEATCRAIVRCAAEQES